MVVAPIRFHGIRCSPVLNADSPTERVVTLPCVMINGQMNPLQRNRKLYKAIVARAVLERGITILQRITFSDAPSIRAASSSSDGIVIMNWYKKKIANPVAASGRIIPCQVSTQPNFAINVYNGTALICGGRSMVAMKKSMITRDPGSSSFAKAYDAKPAVNTVRIVVEHE